MVNNEIGEVSLLRQYAFQQALVDEKHCKRLKFCHISIKDTYMTLTYI